MSTSEERTKTNELKDQRNKNALPIYSELAAIDIAREKLLISFYSVRIARFLDRYKTVIETVLFIFFLVSIFRIVVFLGNSKMPAFLMQFILPTAILSTVFLCFFVKDYRNFKHRIENRALRLASSSFEDFNKRRKIAIASLDNVSNQYVKELEGVYGRWSTYPPDWEDRNKEVLARDVYACTTCGWPNGSKRNTRELHVHHKTPISLGGSHDMSNLTTLCDVCHKKAHGALKIARKTNRRPTNYRALRDHIQSEKYIKLLNEMTPQERELLAELLNKNAKL